MEIIDTDAHTTLNTALEKAEIVEDYRMTMEKEQRKRSFGDDGGIRQQNHTWHGVDSHEKRNDDASNTHAPEQADATRAVPKKKPKQVKQTPAFVCDIDYLFSNGGKRAQGTHLKFTDIRNLYMLTVNGDSFPCFPTWCRLNAWKKIQKTLILMLGCVSGDDYAEHKDCFEHLNSAFGKPIPVRLEGSDHSMKSPLESFLRYRMPRRLQQTKGRENDGENSKSSEFYDHVLTEQQLETNEFPAWNSSAREHGVRSTRRGTERTPPNKDSKLFAIDCEMCVGSNNKYVLTRISIVDSNLETVYDKLVKPDVPIIDYVTKYSGITPEMLVNVTTSLADVQREFLEIIAPDAIIAGHSLEFDLRALKIHHDNVIDTSVLYVDQRGPRFKSSLKNLVKTYLGRDIQNSEGGHCSVEDAKSVMELVLLKLQNGESLENADWEFESVFEAVHREGKQGAIIDTPDVVRRHCYGSVHGVPCVSDEDVVKNAKRFAKKVNFTFAHLKTYENLLNGGSSVESLSREKKEEVLTALDIYVSEILSSVDPETLVIVSLSSGYVHPDVAALFRDKEQRRSETVRAALKAAKNAVCFIKVT